ncbi:MAG: hypothetical protein ACRD0W_18245 [Acidimicrobiales bacterium]
MASQGGSEKLSSRARRLLSDVQLREAASDEWVDLLIRTAGHGDEAREILEATGAVVRTVAGDVCTASAPLSALDRLAELDDVISIDVSGELFPEMRPPTD